ncbi:Soluble lytic murein transglycosylase precursor [Chitinispirillum alkaliphilum]|nr:Soluble lytic murein transglycosylase precursor [Chitinispirillum alkaliphilum]
MKKSLIVMVLFLAGASELLSGSYFPYPVNWSGVPFLQNGDYEEALAQWTTGEVSDTSYHFFKLGLLHVRKGNYDEAASKFNAIIERESELAPLAFEQMAFLHTQQKMYSEALGFFGKMFDYTLPDGFRDHIFQNVHDLISLDTSLKTNDSWFDDYKRWEIKMLAVGIGEYLVHCDSLIGSEQWDSLASSLTNTLPLLDSRGRCRAISHLAASLYEPEALTGEFLFSMAKWAHECRHNVIADQLLSSARSREDFSTAVRARDALLLDADIAFGRGQFDRAARLYQNYDRRFGNESRVVMQIARAYRRKGDRASADRWYDAHLRVFPSHASSQEIRWLRAWDHEIAGNYRQAATKYRQIMARSTGRRAQESHLRHALCHYRLGEYDSAVKHLGDFMKKYPRSTFLWAAMFWQGKSYLAQDRNDDAFRLFRNLSRLDPADYYAHRARQIMKEQGEEVSEMKIWATSENPEVHAWLDSISPSSKKPLTRADSLNLRFGAILALQGRPELADIFLGYLERSYHGNLRLQFDLANIYSMAGSEALAFSVARRLAWRIPVEHRENMPVSIYTLMYPTFYSEVITEYARKFEVDPLLVSSVMRQESIFDKLIVSPAGAIGLMQIMPATGRMIASERNEVFEVDSLYSPVLNIRFGTYYINKRLNQFENNKVLMLASYNAGPHNAQRWYNRNKDSEFDLFVEDIGFTETRNYIKKVLGNYWTYQQLSNLPEYSGFGL